MAFHLSENISSACKFIDYLKAFSEFFKWIRFAASQWILQNKYNITYRIENSKNQLRKDDKYLNWENSFHSREKKPVQNKNRWILRSHLGHRCGSLLTEIVYTPDDWLTSWSIFRMNLKVCGIDMCGLTAIV